MDKPLVAIYKIREAVYRARILFPGKFIPVDYIRQEFDETQLKARLLMFMGIAPACIVSTRMFEAELDYIKLFGARSDEAEEDFYLPEHERLDDAQIHQILADCNALLDKATQRIDELNERDNALLPSGDMEN